MSQGESEKIIKVEHIAETLVYDFFKIFLSQSKSIDAYKPEELSVNKKTPFKLTPSVFETIFGELPDVTMQFQVEKFFKVTDNWKQKLLKKDGGTNLIIDQLTCFDCALEKNKKVLAIEVKSGQSDRYKNVNSILRYSYAARSLDVTEEPHGNILVGDMISILNGPEKVAKGTAFGKINLIGGVLEPIKQVNPDYQLVTEWILVVRSKDHLDGYTHHNASKISYILTLEDMVNYLADHPDFSGQIVEDTKNLSFKERLWNDFLRCLNEISPVKQLK